MRITGQVGGRELPGRIGWGEAAGVGVGGGEQEHRTTVGVTQDAGGQRHDAANELPQAEHGEWGERGQGVSSAGVM